MDIGVGRGELGRDTTRQMIWNCPSIFFDLREHLIVDLGRVDLEIELLVFDERVDALSEHGLEIGLTGSSSGVRRHHA